MSDSDTKNQRKETRPSSQPGQPVIGAEAEFTVYVDDEKVRPEDIFGNPQAIVRAKMMHRPGRSYHLPSGGAIYFDTGVIEVATPIIEIEKHCCQRVVRSLWEQIAYIRAELDIWERKHGCRVRLEGFSTHYSVSLPSDRPLDEVAASRLALLLTYLLAVPGILLAANRLSTGIGVRPRGNRVEVTADFTPDPELMLAAATLFTAVVRGATTWPDHGLPTLRRRRIPVIKNFQPRKHTSRQGWLARFDCFPRNPFTADVAAEEWSTTDGRTMSLRQIGQDIARRFEREMRSMADREVVNHVRSVLQGRARSLLDFAGRPPLYSDVGRIIHWDRRRMRSLPRSAYEQVIQRILTGRPLRLGKKRWIPERMKGWFEIVFREQKSGTRHTFDLDRLAQHFTTTSSKRTR